MFEWKQSWILQLNITAKMIVVLTNKIYKIMNISTVGLNYVFMVIPNQFWFSLNYIFL